MRPLSLSDPAGADAGNVGQGTMASLPGALAPASAKYMPSQGAGAQLGSLGGETEMTAMGGGRAKSSHQVPYWETSLTVHSSRLTRRMKAL